MNPKQLLESIPTEDTKLLGSSTECSMEAHIIDRDGRRWHVAVRALPAHGEWDWDNGKPRREVIDL